MLVIVVISPATSWRHNRGFRHAVVPGEARSLCGRNVEEWHGDLRTLGAMAFADAKVGCRTCIRVHAARETTT
jgi:hypothetical protein